MCVLDQNYQLENNIHCFGRPVDTDIFSATDQSWPRNFLLRLWFRHISVWVGIMSFWSAPPTHAPPEKNWHQCFPTPCRKLKSNKNSLQWLNSKFEKSFKNIHFGAFSTKCIKCSKMDVFEKLFSILELIRRSESLSDFSFRHGVEKPWYSLSRW